MADEYYIDLESISLDDYKKKLTATEIVPSRQILQEKTAERFRCLQKLGIGNLQDCLTALKTAEKVKQLSEASGLSEDYLLTLRREINSFHPKPIQFSKIPMINENVLKKLESAGVKNTKQLFNKARTIQEREVFSRLTGISADELLELIKLTDLSRIKWIGPIFTRMFFESGVDTAEKVSRAKAADLFKRLKAINEKHGFTRANFIENDLRIAIDVAKDVPKNVEY